MAAQGEALAAKLREATDQLVATVEGCSDAQWRAATAAEGWTVAATAHHAARGLAATSRLMMRVANALPPPPITMEGVDSRNAQGAQEFANCSKVEAIDLARQNSMDAADMLRGFNEEQLGRTAMLPFLGNATMSTAQLAERMVLGHLLGHLESIQASL